MNTCSVDYSSACNSAIVFWSTSAVSFLHTSRQSGVILSMILYVAVLQLSLYKCLTRQPQVMGR